MHVRVLGVMVRVVRGTESAGVGDDDTIVPTSDSPTDAFSSWYGALDDVFRQAEASDPKLAKKAAEPFMLDGKLVDNGCEDKNEKCAWWAEIGECHKNPGCAYPPPSMRALSFCVQHRTISRGGRH